MCVHMTVYFTPLSGGIFNKMYIYALTSDETYAYLLKNSCLNRTVKNASMHAWVKLAEYSTVFSKKRTTGFTSDTTFSDKFLMSDVLATNLMLTGLLLLFSRFPPLSG